MTKAVCKDNITELLGQWQDADKVALDNLSKIVYGELKRRAKVYMKQRATRSYFRDCCIG